MIDLLFIERQMKDYECRHGRKPNTLQVSQNTFEELLNLMLSEKSGGVQSMKLLGARVMLNSRIPDGIFEMTILKGRGE